MLRTHTTSSITLINVDPVLRSDRYAKKAAGVFDSGDGGGLLVPKETTRSYLHGVLIGEGANERTDGPNERS